MALRSPYLLRRCAGSYQTIGLFLGPVAFVLTLMLPRAEGLSEVGQGVLATTLWTAIWWMTEAIPINAASFLPFLLFPFLGVMDATDAARAGMNDSIYLFAGGFFLAAALERWGFHRRMALATLITFGNRPQRLILGVMSVVAFLSFWLTNTATVVMMLPILVAVVNEARRKLGDSPECARFASALLLGTALAANIGGMGTPVGTVPNAVMIGQLAKQGIEISFLKWMAHAVPVVIALIPLCFLLLVHVTARVPRDLTIGDQHSLRQDRLALGAWTPAEKRLAMIFGFTVILWITRQDVVLSEDLRIPGWASFLEDLGLIPQGAGKGIRDGSVSVLAALLLFSIPSGIGKDRLLDWDHASRVPWGVLFLLAGGFILAEGFTVGGDKSLGSYLGAQLEGLREIPLFWQLLGITLVVSFLTEFASNTATCTLLIPLIIALFAPTGLEYLPHCFAVALGASCSFMMPVATPPNALVFSTGMIPIGRMVRNGLLLNVTSAVVVASILWAIASFF
jgi:sodium-dependent dicarboxylate transporter 2/3/5